MLQGEHSAILSHFIKLPFALIPLFCLFFEWPLKTVCTVLLFCYGGKSSLAIIELHSG